MSLKNRVVLVTGADGNVGRATVLQLRTQGARIATVQRKPVRGGSAPPNEVALQADLSDEASVEAAFNAAENALGPIWAVVHIAGQWDGGSPVQDTTLALFDSMVASNLRTTFVVGRAAMRVLVPRRGGRIVTVGAYTAATFTQLAGSAAYNVSKAGVIALTKALAEEGRAHGVFANCVAPSTIATDANRAAMPSADGSRWVPVEAVVDALLMAASPESGLNGAVLTLSGR